MDLKSKLKSDLKRHEGTGPIVNGKFHMYHDTMGVPTIGYGENIKGREQFFQSGLSQQEAEYLLDRSAGRAIDQLDNVLPNWRNLPEEAQLILSNMSYNLGATKLKDFKGMLKALDSKDYFKAAQEMRNSKWFGQVKDRGKELVSRMESVAVDEQILKNSKTSGIIKAVGGK